MGCAEIFMKIFILITGGHRADFAAIPMRYSTLSKIGAACLALGTVLATIWIIMEWSNKRGRSSKPSNKLTDNAPAGSKPGANRVLKRANSPTAPTMGAWRSGAVGGISGSLDDNSYIGPARAANPGLATRPTVLVLCEVLEELGDVNWCSTLAGELRKRCSAQINFYFTGMDDPSTLEYIKQELGIEAEFVGSTDEVRPVRRDACYVYWNPNPKAKDDARTIPDSQPRRCRLWLGRTIWF